MNSPKYQTQILSDIMNLTKLSKDLETSATTDKIKKLKLVKP